MVESGQTVPWTIHRFTLTMHVDLTMIGTEDREDGQSLTHDIELIATVINRSKKSIFWVRSEISRTLHEIILHRRLEHTYKTTGCRKWN